MSPRRRTSEERAGADADAGLSRRRRANGDEVIRRLVRPRDAKNLQNPRFLADLRDAVNETRLVKFGSTVVSVSTAEACAPIGTLHPVWASLTTLAEVEAEVEAARLQTIPPPQPLIVALLRYAWATQQRNLWLLARVAAAEAIH